MFPHVLLGLFWVLASPSAPTVPLVSGHDLAVHGAECAKGGIIYLGRVGACLVS